MTNHIRSAERTLMKTFILFIALFLLSGGVSIADTPRDHGSPAITTECAMCRIMTSMKKGTPFFDVAKEMHAQALVVPPDPHWYCTWVYYYDPASPTITKWEALPSSRLAVKFTPANLCTVWNVRIPIDLKKNSPFNFHDTLDIQILEANASYTQIFKTFFLINPFNPIEPEYNIYPPLTGVSQGAPIINTRRDFYLAAKMRGPSMDSVCWIARSPGINTARSIRFTGTNSTQTVTTWMGNSADLSWEAELCIKIPIPVELSLFNATSHARGVKLEWETATETNNYGFHLLRSSSKDGPWEPRMFIPGKGNASIKQRYEYDDAFDVTDALKSGRQTIWYRLKQIDYDGSMTDLTPIKVMLADQNPEMFSLEQNFPNPLSASDGAATTIQYRLPYEQQVKITIFDPFGRTVETLIDEKKLAGIHQLLWRPMNLESGSYIIRMDAGLFSSTRKMLLVR